MILLPPFGFRRGSRSSSSIIIIRNAANESTAPRANRLHRRHLRGLQLSRRPLRPQGLLRRRIPPCPDRRRRRKVARPRGRPWPLSRRRQWWRRRGLVRRPLLGRFCRHRRVHRRLGLYRMAEKQQRCWWWWSWKSQGTASEHRWRRWRWR